MRVLCCVLLLAVACKPPDPNDPKTWEAKLADGDAHVRQQAIQQLRKLKAKEAAPQIAQLLKDPLCREDAALALQDLGGPSQVSLLEGAIDTTVGAGSDAAARLANRTNAKIAEALGNIGPDAASAAPAVLRLARASDDLVRVSACAALGKMKSKEAVPELSRIVDDPASPPLLVKKAIVSLGQIGDPAAIPALAHGLTQEKLGVSYFPESSFALFQIGEPAVEPLLKIAQDQDPAYLAWAKENDRAAAGTYAKTALVLGDIGDAKAVPVLIAKLKYTDPDPAPGTSKILSELVREFSANALGKLRAKEAAAPIQALITPKDEGDLVQFAAEALVWIGDRSQAKEMLKKASQAGPRGRWSIAENVAMLGEPSQSKDLHDLAAKAGKGTQAACAKDLVAMGEADSEKPCEALQKPLEDAAAALATACDNGGCWRLKLSDAMPLVRARAAYELGRAQSADAVPGLTKLCKDDELFVRAAAIRALDWLTSVPAAQKALQTAAPTLEKQLEDEAGKQRFSKVDEDLRRLTFKLSRL